ncbi:hypothetical protein LCGC14_1873610 [marine sediment metagenome]|uniref:Uncharacterized protein n=1 Tax=marine sediment metagenome TaxID=412755 RepID=A0A0F9G4E4_9ZZZZ
MKKTNVVQRGVRLCAVLLLSGVSAAAAAQPQELIEMSGCTGGLVVHAGAADETLGRLLAQSSPAFVVQVLLKDGVAEARERLHGQKLLGRVFVDPSNGQGLSGGALSCVDSSVNLLIAEGPIDADEIQRVLGPGGVALLKRGRRGSV